MIWWCVHVIRIFSRTWQCVYYWFLILDNIFYFQTFRKNIFFFFINSFRKKNFTRIYLFHFISYSTTKTGNALSGKENNSDLKSMVMFTFIAFTFTQYSPFDLRRFVISSSFSFYNFILLFYIRFLQFSAKIYCPRTHTNI